VLEKRTGAWKSLNFIPQVLECTTRSNCGRLKIWTPAQHGRYFSYLDDQKKLKVDGREKSEENSHCR